MISYLPQWFISLLPAPSSVNWGERTRSGLSAFLGLIITIVISKEVVGTPSVIPILIGPMGATALLVFCVPASPMAQPWAVLGGNMISALIGVVSLKLFHDPLLAAPVALASAITVMFAMRCLHPPGGAVALTAVLSGPGVAALGYSFALLPVGLNSLLLVCMAVVLNKASRRRYPHAQQSLHAIQHSSSEPAPAERLGFSEADLDAIFERYGQVLDVSRDDLESLFMQAEMQAYRRRFGTIRCADMMTHNVIAVEYGTSLQEAWMLLRDHQIAAMPVVDPARRVIGMITKESFMRGDLFDKIDGITTQLRTFIKPPSSLYADKPEAVGQIMTPSVNTIMADRPFIELVPLMTDTGQRHIPITDQERRLVGIVSQSDLITALYGSGLTEALHLDAVAVSN